MSNKKIIWHEKLYNSFGQYFNIDSILFHKKTSYHDLLIFENDQFGRIMTLDGIVQTTEKDEFIYHEMITHIPIISHKNVKNILIIGGGDGGTLREICKHSNIISVTLVEIDKYIIKVCKKYLPNHNAGAFLDPRLNLIIEDGSNFINQCQEKFDIIISDCTDPINFGKNLFTYNFYKNCARCLNNNGIFVSQNGVYFLQMREVIESFNKLKLFFNHVSFYQASIPTYYGGNMIFSFASKNFLLKNIEKEILTNHIKQIGLKCRYYNSDIHNNSFSMPQYFLDSLLLTRSKNI